MGLDVYVGSLTRYYLEGSADVVERIAHHQGLPVDDGQDGEESSGPRCCAGGTG